MTQPASLATAVRLNIAVMYGRLEGFVSLRVYYVPWREVRTLVSEVKRPGSYEVQFDGRDLPSGVYFYRLTDGAYTSTKRMLLLK